MRRIIINPSGEEQQNYIQDLVIDLILGAFGFFGVLLTTASVLRYFVGVPLLDPVNLLLTLLGAATVVTMIRIHRETALPGEGAFWMTRRTSVGLAFHCLLASYTVFLMALAFDIPPFRRIPMWVYSFIVGFF